MTQFSSVIAAKIDFVIQRGSNKGWAIRWNRNGSYVDWSKYPGTRMDIRNSSGQIVLSHTIGDGLVVHSDPTYLKIRPWGSDNDKDLPPSPPAYEHDLKVPFTTTIVRYPVRGIMNIVDNITK